MLEADFEACYNKYAHLLYGRLLSKKLSTAAACEILKKAFVDYYTQVGDHDCSHSNCFITLVKITEKYIQAV